MSIAEVSELIPGSSALIPTKCTAATGPANVDGRCIMGGALMPDSTRGYNIPSIGLAQTNRCVAFPAYLISNVPYTNGSVAGREYSRLSNLYTYTKLNALV